jgi:hypothetical protein
MGHSIDSLKYTKIRRDKKYALEQYRKALPWLNIMSEDPRKVDSVDVEAKLEACRACEEALGKRMELEEKVKLLANPELLRLLRKAKKNS